MSEQPELPGLPPPPEPPKPTWFKRLPSRLFGRWKWPGWTAFLYLVFTEVPDWRHRIDFWLSTAEKMGGYIGSIAAVVGSTYFRWALFVGAIGYLVFVGEPKRGVQRHYWLPYAAWSILGICLTVTVIATGWGAIQAYIQTQVLHGIEARQLPDRRLSQDVLLPKLCRRRCADYISVLWVSPI